MNETTILLAPSPKAKAEFLVTVEPMRTDNGDLPFEVTLDGYTRDKWGCDTTTDDVWKATWLKSVDGRRKLPGFLKYLKDRKKSAFGKFEAVADDESTTRAVFVVPFDQPTPPEGLLGGADGVSGDEVIYCRYSLDARRIKGQQRPQQLPQNQRGTQRDTPGRDQQSRPAPGKTRQPQAASAPAPSSRAGKRGGLLGGLLGAQRRTNTHLAKVPVQKKKEEPSVGGGGFGGPPTGTAGAAITKFRSDTEQRLLDFQKSAENMLKINVTLTDIIRDLPPDQKPNVSMDVLKYVIYEQTEEIGEDKWVASKEPTEFLDEIVVAIYKEGHCPPEVLEEMNQGELPDEIRQQQRGMQEARLKEQMRKEAKRDAILQKMTVGRGADHDLDFQQLNTNKRDRRTIEEIQKDIIDDNKRQKI